MRVIDEEKASGVTKLSKTIKLPTRELKCIKQQPEVVKDEDKLLEWVESNLASTIPYVELQDFLDKKDEEFKELGEIKITIQEILNIVKKYDVDYINREPKLKWGDFKKSLKQSEVKISEIDADGNEIVVGTRLAYFDENGQEVPYIELIERGESFDWKLVREKEE